MTVGGQGTIGMSSAATGDRGDSRGGSLDLIGLDPQQIVRSLPVPNLEPVAAAGGRATAPVVAGYGAARLLPMTAGADSVTLSTRIARPGGCAREERSHACAKS